MLSGIVLLHEIKGDIRCPALKMLCFLATISQKEVAKRRLLEDWSLEHCEIFGSFLMIFGYLQKALRGLQPVAIPWMSVGMSKSFFVLTSGIFVLICSDFPFYIIYLVCISDISLCQSGLSYFFKCIIEDKRILFFNNCTVKGQNLPDIV